jgi:hypothetical protein
MVKNWGRTLLVFVIIEVYCTRTSEKQKLELEEAFLKGKI